MNRKVEIFKTGASLPGPEQRRAGENRTNHLLEGIPQTFHHFYGSATKNNGLLHRVGSH